MDGTQIQTLLRREGNGRHQVFKNTRQKRTRELSLGGEKRQGRGKRGKKSDNGWMQIKKRLFRREEGNGRHQAYKNTSEEEERYHKG